MSKSNFNEDKVIDSQFGADSISPATAYVAFHTADPGQAGNQSTNEATYTGYARQPIVAVTGWTLTQGQAANALDIEVPEATAGSELLTHFSVGVAVSGATNIQYSAALTSNVQIDVGVIVKINAGNLIIIEQ